MKGYSREYLERVLGRLELSGEKLVGKKVDNSYIIMVRNDDLNPPYGVVRTHLCSTCNLLILPIASCKCSTQRAWRKGDPDEFEHEVLVS
jgi:hypothetical protein